MANQKIILIVDDEPNIVTYLEMLLRDNGYQTFSADNGEQGLEVARREKPDLMTLDISMPESSGVRCLKEMKSDPEMAAIPVVVVTGVTGYAGDPYGYMKFISKQSNLPDPDGFFPKPIDTKELFSTLVKWIAPGDRKMQGDSATPGLEDQIQPADDSMPELPGISVVDGLKKVGGNEKFYRKLLLQFLDTNRESANEIREAIDKKDQPLAVRLAHTVKGVAGTLGAAALARVSGELEIALKNEAAGELSNLLEQFESHLNPVMQAIEKSDIGKKEKIDSGESSGQDPVDNAVVGPIIQELFDLMETDLVEARSRLEDLGKHLANSKLGEQFRTLENQMDIFDIPAVLETLKAIADELNLTTGEGG